MASSAPSKKRKRAQVEDNNAADKLSLKASGLPEAQLGPVLVSFPAVQPPEKTSFQYYFTGKGKDADEQDFADRPAVVQGEAATVDFSTAIHVDRKDAGSTYYVAIHNKRTKTTTFRPAPIHILQREPKALKGIPPAAVTAADRIAARNSLGATFGTKKAQAALRAQERNKIDVSAMSGVIGHLQDRVAHNTGALPSKEEAIENADNARLIPHHNSAATDPAQAYPLSGIVPEPEWNAISVSAILQAKDVKERMALLPNTKNSDYVWQHMKTIFAGPKPKKEDVKKLVYIVYLLAFRSLFRTLDSMEKIQQRMKGVPQIVIEGMLSRFAEATRGSSTVQKTSTTETKLMTHIFALCLHLDDFAVDTSVLAKDLSMTVANVNNLFKTLGCTIEKLNATELRRLGLPDSAGLTKRAVLRMPLTFPKPRAKRKTAGR